jgi:glycosyltransferase involved in cell wall biosynthesis
MQMSEPIVSVIISTYNSERFIRGRLENLIGQTIFHNTEIVVVNSGSQEGEEMIVREYVVAYPNISYTATIERETIYRAWNRGIALARGKFITNANTDDVLRNDALETLASALDANPGVAMVYADQYVSHTANQLFVDAQKRNRLRRPPYSRIALLQGSLAGSQPMWRASVHSADNIWFDEQFEVAGDYGFACAVAEKYDLLKIDDVLGVYYKAKDLSNKEFSNVSQTVSEAFATQEKYGRRYVVALSAAERDSLFTTCSRLMRMPRVFFRIGREVGARLFPAIHVSSKMFWCWLASLIKEVEGDIVLAKRCCLPIYRTGSENLVQRQFTRLTTTYAQ